MATPSTYFGKLPFHGDFVGLANPGPAARALDDWFQAGMLRIREARPQWQDEFDALPPTRLLLLDEALPGPFAAVFWPSRDRIGRRYPFVLGAQIPDCPHRSCLSAIPMAVDDYLSVVEMTAPDPRRADQLDAFRSRAAEIVWTGFRDEPLQLLGLGLSGSPTAALWRDLPGFAAPQRRAVLLDDLRALADAPSPPRYVLRIPCRGDALTLGFWLGLFEALDLGHRPPRLIGWSTPDPCGRVGSLRVLYDELSPRHFEPFFWTENENALAFDLTYASSPSAEQAQRAAGRFGSAIEHSASLANLLAAVADRQRQP